MCPRKAACCSGDARSHHRSNCLSGSGGFTMPASGACRSSSCHPDLRIGKRSVGQSLVGNYATHLIVGAIPGSLLGVPKHTPRADVGVGLFPLLQTTSHRRPRIALGADGLQRLAYRPGGRPRRSLPTGTRPPAPERPVSMPPVLFAGIHGRQVGAVGQPRLTPQPQVALHPPEQGGAGSRRLPEGMPEELPIGKAHMPGWSTVSTSWANVVSPSAKFPSRAEQHVLPFSARATKRTCGKALSPRPASGRPKAAQFSSVSATSGQDRPG